MAVGVLSLSGSVSGIPTGSKNITVPQITSQTAVGQISNVSLILGDNVIAVPTGATSAVIMFPSGNIQVVRIKGAGGDVGVALRNNTWSAVSLDPTQTSFILNAAGVVAGVEISFI